MNDKDKEARLAAALRENLRKRKVGSATKKVAPDKARTSSDEAVED